MRGWWSRKRERERRGERERNEERDGGRGERRMKGWKRLGDGGDEAERKGEKEKRKRDQGERKRDQKERGWDGMGGDEAERGVHLLQINSPLIPRQINTHFPPSPSLHPSRAPPPQSPFLSSHPVLHLFLHLTLSSPLLSSPSTPLFQHPLLSSLLTHFKPLRPSTSSWSGWPWVPLLEYCSCVPLRDPLRVSTGVW